MATLQSGKCFTVPTFFGMCCRSEWQERMYIYKWHEVDQTKHEIFCVHIVCNEIQVKVNLEITTFFFYLRFPYCPNFFWFGVVNAKLTGRKNLGRKRCTSNRDDRKLENTVKQSWFKHLGELHKEWTEAGVSASRVTTLRRLQEKGYQATSEPETTSEASYLGCGEK